MSSSRGARFPRYSGEITIGAHHASRTASSRVPFSYPYPAPYASGEAGVDGHCTAPRFCGRGSLLGVEGYNPRVPVAVRWACPAARAAP